LLVRAYSWKRDLENLTAVLERLAEAAQAVGFENDERYALSCLIHLAPEQTDRLERLNELGGMDHEATGEFFSEFEPSVSVVQETSEAELVIESDDVPCETTEFEMTSDAVAVEHESTAGMEIERGDAFEGASNEQPAAPSEDLTFESDGDQ